MPRAARSRQLETVAHPLTGAPEDDASFLALMGNTRIILLGEASHGTHAFYRECAQVTKRFIQEKGFTAVAVETDWPDAYRDRTVLRYLDKIDPETARRARYRYGCFERFGEDTQAYGYVASIGLSKSCEDDVVSQPIELQRRDAGYAEREERLGASSSTLLTWGELTPAREPRRYNLKTIF